MKFVIGIILIIISVYGQDNLSENATFLPQKQDLEPNAVLSPKLISTSWLKPLTDTVANFVALAKHPNYGGVQFFNPQNLWEMLHEKGVSYLTGPHGAVFGTAQNGPLDYPFAYRKKTN
ncbi:uncharacterized protein LOC123009110 [Tribolium madens]|uniref:uncharacterized protein LOC123009110 n=1 Tax=Tribolium madens TaxID=41895 RepID=UPI001CF735F1|nr:uncharacterized protein LOC123009110 [Tribolium madens]